jgi:hypothetical protein
MKWNNILIRKESKRVHGDIFIIGNIERKEYGNQGCKMSYINLKCKICNYENLMAIKSHIHKKIGCKQCSKNMWTLKKAQDESNRIHNNNFILYSLERKEYGSQGQKTCHIDIKCKSCGDRKITTINNHISKSHGCSGKCQSVINRTFQINTLREDMKLADQLYKLYFLKFTHKLTNEQFYKVGKTKKTINYRFKDKQYNNYIIEECQVVESTHLWVAEQEDLFINKYYNKYGYKPIDKFGGHTECFNLEVINEF